MPSRAHPLFCIVPPHMLSEIEQRGSDARRAVASRMAGLSDRVRRDRVAALGDIAAQAVPAATSR